MLPVLVLSALAAGCADKDAGSVEKSLTTPYIQTATAKAMSEEKVARQTRSGAMGVMANLGGPAEVVRAQLGVGIVVLGTVPFPEGQKYIEGVRDKLLAVWPYDVALGQPNVEITCNSEYGAESLADNTIQIPVGVIEKANSEDEIAFVVGHESGHLLMQHQARREAAINRADIGITVASMGAMVAGDLLSAKRSGVGDAVQYTLKPGAAIGLAVAQSGSQMAGAEILTTLIDPGWGRRQEEQADLVGIDLMTAAGYNPEYASAVFEEVLEEEKKGQQRQTELEAQKARQTAEAGRQQPVDPDNSLSIDTILSEVLTPVTSWIGSGLKNLRINHPDTESREKAAADYRDRFYADAEVRKPQDDQLKRLQTSRGFRNVTQAITHVRGASDALDGGAPDRAITEAIAAQRLLPAWWVPSYVAGIAYLDAGRTSEGVKQLIRATDQPAAPYPVFERAAFELGASGDTGGAIQVLDKAAERFGGGGRDLAGPNHPLWTERQSIRCLGC